MVVVSMYNAPARPAMGSACQEHFEYIIQWRVDMKRTALLAVLILCVALIGSCSSFAYLQSDDYRQAGIRVTTNPADAAHLQVANRWSSEFVFTYSAQDVGVWSANRLAKDGRHDVLVLVELISGCIPPVRGTLEDQNMWRISVYPLPAEDAAK
jgi:hypothetical protein